MTGRTPNEARTYLRRSTGKQPTGIYSSLDWAIETAAKHGVRLDAKRDDLDHMLEDNLIQHKGIFLDDGVTGADLDRPGFTACRNHVKANRSVSHLLIHMADRFARPDVAAKAMVLEADLLFARITVVFSDRVSQPRQKGLDYTVEDMHLLMAYSKSGHFLNELAVRVI
jgi:DNA invertase Pin-like site-specific DNA recombinase